MIESRLCWNILEETECEAARKTAVRFKLPVYPCCCSEPTGHAGEHRCDCGAVWPSEALPNRPVLRLVPGAYSGANGDDRMPR